MHTVPYIGVSAFQEEADVREVSAALGQMSWPTKQGHVPVIGFAADSRTINSQPPSYRKVESLNRLNRLIGEVHSPVLASIHFDCKAVLDQPPSAHSSLRQAHSFHELVRTHSVLFRGYVRELLSNIDTSKLHSVQLNGVVRPEELHGLHEDIPQVPLIYQLRKELLALGTDAVREHMRMCAAAVQHVLIDLSAGTGKQIDPALAVELTHMISEECPHALVGIAGGLSPENVVDLHGKTLSVANRNVISVDAETSVRRVDNTVDAERAILFYQTMHAHLE